MLRPGTGCSGVPENFGRLFVISGDYKDKIQRLGGGCVVFGFVLPTASLATVAATPLSFFGDTRLMAGHLFRSGNALDGKSKATARVDQL